MSSEEETQQNDSTRRPALWTLACVVYSIFISLVYVTALVVILVLANQTPNYGRLVTRTNVTSISVPAPRVVSEDGRSVFRVDCTKKYEKEYEDRFLCVARAGPFSDDYDLPITPPEDYDGHAPALVCAFVNEQVVVDSCWFKTKDVALPIPIEKYFPSFLTGVVGVSLGVVFLVCVITCVMCGAVVNNNQRPA